jgi:hypothetical protein
VTDRTAVRVETEHLDGAARDRLVERLIAEAADDLAVVEGTEARAAVLDALGSGKLTDDPPPALGTQFVEGADPKVVLIVLESCHILIETTRAGTHLKNRLAERLDREGERIEHVTLDEFADVGGDS